MIVPDAAGKFPEEHRADESGGEAPLAVGRGEDQCLRFRECLQRAEGDEPRGVTAAERTGERGEERGERERGEPAERAEEKEVFVRRHEVGRRRTENAGRRREEEETANRRLF